MLESVGRAVLVAALLASCSSNGANNNASAPDAARDGAGGTTSGPGTGGSPGTGGGPGSGGTPGSGGSKGTPDASPTAVAPTDCRGILVCVFACGTDTACAARCASQAPAAAQALYKQIRDCSGKACPDQTDIACRCENECYAGGQCSELVDQCDDADPDMFCDPAGVICGI
jgi:hypothetical protein